MPRRQLPVHSPIRASALGAALGAALARRGADHEMLAARLSEMFGADGVVLTDSGTSALVLALRATAGEGGTVALPAYACVDLAAAAVHARVRVRLYDIDPETLGPDLDSLARVLTHDVAAVVVAHLYGFPVDVPAVDELAAAHGATVIEDAAQGDGATLRGARLGSFGSLSVLSFGRGKGITGGRGGALLATAPGLPGRTESAARRERIRAGWGDLVIAAAQWMLGRPALYWIPSAVPGLRLGESVYHAAHDPGALSVAAAALVRLALPCGEVELATRRRHAEVLVRAVQGEKGFGTIRPIPEGTPGYLRFPVRDLRQRFLPRMLGIVRGYPRTLLEERNLHPCLDACRVALPGATELSRSLVTLPVHGLVTRRDLERMRAWLQSADPRGPQRIVDADKLADVREPDARRRRTIRSPFFDGGPRFM